MKLSTLYLMLILAFTPVQLITAQTPEFANSDFESSTTCQPNSCAFSSIDCIDEWWNYYPGAFDNLAWFRYVCNSIESCGNERGLLLKADGGVRIYGATNNPVFGYEMNSLYAISLDAIIANNSAFVVDAYVWVWGTNDLQSGTLDLMGKSPVKINLGESCQNVTILAGKSIDIANTGKDISEYPYIVFSLSSVYDQHSPPLVAPELAVAIDNLTICEAIAISVDETVCGEELCVKFDVDESCYEFECIGDCNSAFQINDITSGTTLVTTLQLPIEDIVICQAIDAGHQLEVKYIVNYTEDLAIPAYVHQGTIEYQSQECRSITVSTDENWSSSNGTIPGDGTFQEVRIESGSRLVVDADAVLQFCEGGSLIIENGAELELLGKLTSTNCGSRSWLGVVVDGDGTSSQDYINGYVHGYFNGKPGSVIENAIVGIELRGENGTGGIVKCDGTTFLNNQTGVKFSPFTNTVFFTGQPKPYNASFRDCDFLVTPEYQLIDVFKGFATLYGVDGIPFAGCKFKSTWLPMQPYAVSKFGYGVESFRAGFSIVQSTSRRSEIYGLGYGVKVGLWSSIKPYYIGDALFENCYVGLSAASASFGTVVNNEFNMGTVPAAFGDKDQSGIMLLQYQTGFEIQENTFFCNRSNVRFAYGIISDNLGDMNNKIRRNIFDGIDNNGLWAANQMIRINSSFDKDFSRGLFYECNENYNIDQFDFLAGEDPPTTIRKMQGLAQDGPNGLILAAGNKFSRLGNQSTGDYNATFHMDFPGIDYYWFDDAQGKQEPLLFSQTTLFKIESPENVCPIEFCQPPCISQIDLPTRKSEFYTHKTLLQSAINGQDTILATYHRNEMDDIAGKIAQFYLYDTLTYSNDSLRAWYAKMGSITGEIMLAGQYMEEGNYQAAISTINGISSKHALDQDQVDGLSELSLVYGVLNSSKADSLSALDISILMPIAYSTRLASGHAQALLMLNGYLFDPVYYRDNGQQLQYQPFSGSQIDAQKEDFVVVYPNPTSGELYIHIDSDVLYEVPIQFEMFDLQGKLIFSDEIEQMTYSTDLTRMGLASGVYPYRITTASEVLKTGKLIIE